MNNPIDTILDENKERTSLPENKETKAQVDDYLAQMKEFEEDRIELAKSDAKKAWRVAAGFGVVAVISILALMLMTPLKQTVPYLLMVDQNGNTSFAKPLSDAEQVSYGEALDKYWVNTFLVARNGYEWETIQNSYNTVKLMSTDKVFAPYDTYIRSKESPEVLFGENNSLRVVANNITFLPQTSEEFLIAQVQFSREVLNKKGLADPLYKKTFWTATLTFDYLAEIKTEADRMLNPLAFRVTSYREDRILKNAN
ncbi:virB8 family protein [Vibrio cholerae]|uniref:virB8 family protein n=1 Tax=Vibrio cholerae TaxID=666 RepID=UPI00226FD348|nr:type IV secretion system protein [Vibrio cholerae]